MNGIRSFYFSCTSAVCTVTVEGHAMGSDRDRVISISLSEAEWRAFIAQHPQPVSWIQERIREQLRASSIETENLQPRN